MAKSTIHGIHGILSGAFEAAMRWEWTDRNPARSARPPTLHRQTILATRWLAIDPVTCALIASYLAEIKAELAAVGVELRARQRPAPRARPNQTTP